MKVLDLLQKIRSKIESKSGPFVIVFVGINGSGKTTTVAKIGNLLRINGLSQLWQLLIRIDPGL